MNLSPLDLTLVQETVYWIWLYNSFLIWVSTIFSPTNHCLTLVRETLISKPFDENGEIAKSGNVAPEILNEIMEMDYFKMEPPKSTGHGFSVIFT